MSDADKKALRQEIFDRACRAEAVSEEELGLLTIAQLRQLCKEPRIYFGTYGDCTTKRAFVAHVAGGIRRARMRAGDGDE